MAENFDIRIRTILEGAGLRATDEQVRALTTSVQRLKSEASASTFGDVLKGSAVGSFLGGFASGGLGVLASQIGPVMQTILDYQHEMDRAAVQLQEEVRTIGNRWREAAGGARDMNDLLSLQQRMLSDLDRLGDNQAKAFEARYTNFASKLDFAKSLLNRFNEFAGLRTADNPLFKLRADEISEQFAAQERALENEQRALLKQQEEFLKARESIGGLRGQDAITATVQRMGELQGVMMKLAPSTAENRAQIEAYRREIGLLEQSLVRLANEEQNRMNDALARADEADADRERRNRATEKAVAALQISRAQEEEAEAAKLAKEKAQAQLEAARSSAQAANDAEREAAARERARDALDDMRPNIGDEAERAGGRGARARRASRERFAGEVERGIRDAGLQGDEAARVRAAKLAEFDEEMQIRRGRFGSRPATGGQGADITGGGRFDQFGNRVQQSAAQVQQVAAQMTAAQEATNGTVVGFLTQLVALQVALAAQVKVLEGKVGK